MLDDKRVPGDKGSQQGIGAGGRDNVSGVQCFNSLPGHPNAETCPDESERQ